MSVRMRKSETRIKAQREKINTQLKAIKTTIRKRNANSLRTKCCDNSGF